MPPARIVLHQQDRSNPVFRAPGAMPQLFSWLFGQPSTLHMHPLEAVITAYPDSPRVGKVILIIGALAKAAHPILVALSLCVVRYRMSCWNDPRNRKIAQAVDVYCASLRAWTHHVSTFGRLIPTTR